MTADDAKSWMLAKAECEELHCPHLLSMPATQEEPAERDCTCKRACPHDEPARLRFAVVREEVVKEALTESWEELVAPLERLLAAPAHGYGATEGAVAALQARANGLIDTHTLKVLEARHEL